MEYISLSEYAKMHKISHATARQKILRGYLPAKKIGKNWLVKKNEPYIDHRKKGEA